MNDISANEDFFKLLDGLISETKIIIDRPKGSQHPKYPDFVYIVDYGYLQHTLSMDGSGIDVWRGSQKEKRVNGIIVTVDIAKKDSEIKLLIGCTDEEKKQILAFHNKTANMKGILIERDN